MNILLQQTNSRVQLRPWHRHDDLILQAWPPYTDPLNMLWNLPRTPLLPPPLFAYSTTPHIQRLWAIEDPKQRLLGRLSLREIDQKKGSARLGISLSPSHLGQGLGTEALMIFLSYFFGPLEFATMQLDVAALNLRAVRCYLRLGFQPVGDEWREVGQDLTRKLLHDPHYPDLQAHFRWEKQKIFTQFIEMELDYYAAQLNMAASALTTQAV